MQYQQMGFGFEALDPETGEVVPWDKWDDKLIAAIKAAPWKVTDLETTGLTPFSAPVNLNRKELEGGGYARLRVRVATVLIPSYVAVAAGPTQMVAFDMDSLTVPQQKSLADAILTGACFGWNVGFDAFWLRHLTPTTPTLLLDGMLLARLLRPDLPVVMARLCQDEFGDPELVEHARSMFIAERSGWSLADVTAAMFGKVLDKSRQKPKNWTKEVLDATDYGYATDDVYETYAVLCALFDCEPGGDLLAAYKVVREKVQAVSLVEPQVLDIVRLRERGMPFSVEGAKSYASGKYELMAKLAAELVEMEPSLVPFKDVLGSPVAGISAALKAAIGEAFSSRGLVLSYTESTQQPMIGEKDLRKSRAALHGPTKELYKTWVALCKAKKVAQMALENAAFAARSADHRIRSLLGHGPVTGRLSASETNVQQYPRDEHFRALVRAAVGKAIVSCDFSALDMRVGEALAIRAQLQIRDAFLTQTAPQVEGLLNAINYVWGADTEAKLAVALTRCIAMEAETKAELTKLRLVDNEKRDKTFWSKWRKVTETLRVRKFARALAQVRTKAMARGELTWGSLRDAFAIPGMDIHTWTALAMQGRDPAAMFAGKSDDEIASHLKALKKELGDARQSGKVGNLSLLYAMQALGLITAAAKNYDIHWTLEEGQAIIDAWMASYPEIELWHCWTALREVEKVKIPTRERLTGSTTGIYRSVTLGGRTIYAFGLNAALSYEDQSTGADILGLSMRILREEHPDVFACLINQIHDEILAEFPLERAEEMGWTLANVLVQAADHFLSSYGVRVEVSPAIGDVWLKD